MLCRRKGKKRTSVYKIPLKKVEAEANRDALSKAIYGRLFDWLVGQINRNIDHRYAISPLLSYV